MPSHKIMLVPIVAMVLASAAAARAQSPYGIGRSATSAEIAGWDIDIGRDGSNLPPGSGTVSHGREVYEQQCASCHGANGEGAVGDRLVGGQGSLGQPAAVMPGLHPGAGERGVVDQPGVGEAHEDGLGGLSVAGRCLGRRCFPGP